MRDAFIAELHDIAARDPNCLLLAGDIGFKVFDRFRESYPDRFYNLGIAEANMIGVSAGLALSGKRPIVYTIIPFLTMRPFEQIRVDICMNNLPVILVGIGGGLAYDILGPTHHAIEDVAILRALPNMTVLAPCDPREVRAAMRSAYELGGPAYIRLGRGGEPSLDGNARNYEIGRTYEMRAGRDITIIGAGPVLKEALEAASLLEREGIRCGVVNMHTIKPLDREAVIRAAHGSNLIVTLEEHSVIGGLGSAVAEVLAEEGLPVRLKRLGINDAFTYRVGYRPYLLEYHGLNARGVAETIRSLLGQAGARAAGDGFVGNLVES